MPTERFKRLPEEKIEAIRRAGIQEFTRTSPESASINRIIQEADISRGSFYTYFESKYDLLRWLISDRVREPQRFLCPGYGGERRGYLADSFPVPGAYHHPCQ